MDLSGVFSGVVCLKAKSNWMKLLRWWLLVKYCKYYFIVRVFFFMCMWECFFVLHLLSTKQNDVNIVSFDDIIFYFIPVSYWLAFVCVPDCLDCMPYSQKLNVLRNRIHIIFYCRTNKNGLQHKTCKIRTLFLSHLN